MSWFPVDDAFHSHPKAQKAGDEALGMWARAGSHCMAYLTDGFVADWWVKQQARGNAKAKRLVAAGLWREGTNADGEQGFWFHDWKPECTKEHVLAAREKARLRKAKSRESQQESQGESRVTEPVTDAVSPPSCLVPTQPNPTQPIEKNPGCEPSKPTLGSATNAVRGTRIPDGWEPPTDVVAQMRSAHPHVDLRAEHAKFVDYWRAKPGKDGRKTDWNATWRNWIRRTAEQQPALRAVPTNGHAPATAFQRKTAHNAAVFQSLADEPDRPEVEP